MMTLRIAMPGLLGLIAVASLAEQVVIGPESRVPEDPRQQWARYVEFRPADGQVVTLNPPRMSWPYAPQIDPAVKSYPGDRRFVLELSRSKDFTTPDFVSPRTPCNFYNFLPALTGSDTWYWRVCYEPGSEQEQWSETRRFTIADDAVSWDRSKLHDLPSLMGGHPRLLFNAENREEVLSLRDRDERSAELAQYMIAWADGVIEEGWYQQFPTDDSEKLSYMQMCRKMVAVAFAYLLTGDEKYAGFRERFLTVASWPKGGYASPEGAGAVAKWETHVTEYLGLFYDWFYDDLSEAERAVVRGSLEWRIRHTMWSFAWKRGDGETLRAGSIALTCGSHPYENTMVSIPGMIAICDESQVARDALEVSLNYLIGITNGYGEDEGWNEGPGYGNGKMKWLTDATWYAQTAIPGLDLGKNPAYDAYCDFFARITPIGAQHCSFGNRGRNETDWSSSRVTNFRRMAMLTGNGVAMQNWLDTGRRLQDLRGGKTAYPYSPWIDYVLPAYASEPEPKVESQTAKLFPLAGWVTVSSAPPSDYDAQKNAVSMTFHCRPGGGYSHSFRSENAFDIHAYGSTITCGGGTTSNQEFFANHTMSHNTVLVNGREQEASRAGSRPLYGRITRFAQGEGYVYWAGDATKAYADDLGLEKFVRHVLFVDDSYFVIFDELEMGDDAEPATFQWLYHIYPAVELEVTEAPLAVQYQIGRTRVMLAHGAHTEDLTFADYRGAEGMVNPVTGEDVTRADKWLKGKSKKQPQPLDAHHLWVSHRTPRKAMNFLAVVAPYVEEDEPPTITGLGDTAARISFRGKETTISFGPMADADIVVQL